MSLSDGLSEVPDLVGAVRAGGRDVAFEMVTWRGTASATKTWTRDDLHSAARRAAGAIAARTKPGDRVVIAPPPGPGFAALFLGCLGSGRIAVPAQTPATTRAQDFLARIVAATDARLVLTDLILSENGPEIALCAAPADDDAYIQFTSGSTRAPRGAVITHGALAHNLAAIGEAWRLGRHDHGVFWLPPFHDMGLVGALLTPVAFSFPATLMHPAAFLQKPARWLELIASRRATFSGAPNFAYDLCVDRIDSAARASLDLSRWRVAVNGAEPVSAATLDRFSRAFAAQGFRSAAFSPGYGLAEAVLFVTAQQPGGAPAHEDVVSCGAGGRRVTVRIVDETHGSVVPDGARGAIWVAGPSLARGYWAAPEDTAATFGARLAGDERRYLRTGDDGFLRDGALHVSGRTKDLIVRAGRKVHAADIEHAVAQRAGGGGLRRTAAFACAGDGDAERVVVVHETAPGEDGDATRAAIADAIGAACDLVVDDIVLTPRGGVRVTTSGKINRAGTRDAYLAGALVSIPPRTA